MIFPYFLTLFLSALPVLAIFEGCMEGSDRTGYQFKPNCSSINRAFGTKKAWPFKTNEAGLLSVKNFPAHAAPGVLRILILGPSELVNLSDTVGIVPVLEKNLAASLVSKKFPKKKLEVINGAVPGFTAVESFLQLPSLMDRYHPDVVMFQHSLESFALQQVDDHYQSASFDETGKSSSLKKTKEFWFIPKSYEEWIWKNLRNPYKFRVNLQAARLALYKLKISLGIGKYGQKDGFSPYGNVHLKYLRGIKSIAESRGAKFFLLNREDPRGDVEANFRLRQKFNSPLWPEWVAGNILSWSHLRNREAHKIYETIEKEFPVIHLEGIKLAADDFFPNDFRPNEKGLEVLGKAYAEKILPLLQSLNPAPKK